ncbi:7S RNA binding protein [Aureococcus anophagefferens]|nr:7S RNA binding protein [Aureococcus anophagefferens]
MSKKVGGSDAPAADDGDDDDGAEGLSRGAAARAVFDLLDDADARLLDDEDVERLRLGAAARALEALAAKLDREGVFAASSDGAKGLLRLLGGGRPSSEDSDDDENDADDRSGALMRRGDATHGKYVRLLEMKMPEAMLALKMKAEGLDPAVLGIGAAASAPKLAPRLRGPPPPPLRAVARKLKPSGGSPRHGHVRPDLAAFAASSSRVAIKEPNSKRAADELSALDGKRHQSVAIGLRKLRERKLESGAAVAAALDAETLTEEDVALVRRCALPEAAAADAAELAALKALKPQADAGAGALREGDAWVLDARTACPRLRPRLAVAAAKLSAPLRLLAAAEQTDRRAFAVEAVQHSEPLKDVLKIALLAGNALAAVLADVDRDDAATLDELYGDLDGDASTARSEADAADDAALRSWAAWLGDRLADLRAAVAPRAAAALMRSFGDGGAFGEGDAPAQWFKVLRTCLQALLAARDDLLEERAREARREEREVKEAARRRARHRRDEAFDVDDLFPPKRPTPLRSAFGNQPGSDLQAELARKLGARRAGIGSATPKGLGDAADLAADFADVLDGAGEGDDDDEDSDW